jgi:predicted peptidase
MTQQPHHFETMVKRELEYLLYLPKDYGIDNEHSWPMILFLHGIGERRNGGEELERVKMIGLAKLVVQQPDFPFVVVSPQCPSNSWWTYELESLNALLEHILETHAVDSDRVYLTGLSMGGYGAWALAGVYPERFAAVVPICGGGVPPLVNQMRRLPVWAFHGTDDETVPLSESQRMVNALKSLGGDVQLTVYPGVGHDSWTQTYANPELYNWFLTHKRS